ncbi:N(5)-(carboxyethyl)ornithine synthase [Conexibacter woesei]|uniref:Alanine dehydrogenase/PNT domain protein n=1 Tax=Conexibacter woesei (strain DSM 14684 / CCUG 47730 / CIP 108061 / JCM 11494 / NBRC 100937 / ID131577) TaxID=469383 RepID=D3F0U7_CONWI|nr:N(5)-(carboxyethyl)ornithine synthase [Conexibacter woesei]ADB54031.1 alanine dehydrogenase/PNT domain protein [Conexibacter woesei DSM 14684]
MDQLSIGAVATSRKQDELRLAIHPAHVERIDADVRAHLFLERGYGERFGFPDDRLAPLVAGLREREQLFAECDVLLLPKPLAEDLETLRAGQVVWGWPHCVQDRHMTQLAIDRELTLIAWEAMNHWTASGHFDVHVFHKNNELAGYCSVLHALQLLGTTGDYGRRLRAAVISFGATARGAVRALSALGISDVTVMTQRSVAAVASPFASVRMQHFERDPANPSRTLALKAPEPGPLAEVLAGYDVVVNCILQDTDEPLMFVMDEDLGLFPSGTLVVDVSCDEGMGFEWARPTSFADPIFTVGDGVRYYAVDHSPSFLWNSATWENSEALLRYLPVVMAGPPAWDANETIRRAIEIRDGRVLNPRILSFQQRAPDYPYPAA